MTLRWEDLNVDARLGDSLRAIKLEYPLEVQRQVLPYALDHRDVLLCAPTGSGKTVSFLIPALQEILWVRTMQQGAEQGIRALVLEPTEELATQVLDVLLNLIKGFQRETPIQVGNNSLQLDVLVCTPTQFLELKVKPHNLKNLQNLVVDEADLMLATGQKQSVQQILGLLPGESQKILVSATLAQEISDFSQFILQDPKVINIQNRSEDELKDLPQRFIFSLNDEQKFLYLYGMFSTKIISGQTLIFTDKQMEGYRIQAFLEKCQIVAGLFDPNMPVEVRTIQLQKFNSKMMDIMIFVDSGNVGRGLDFQDVAFIINFSLPTSLSQHIHRVGRAGRGLNEGQMAISFVQQQVDRYVGNQKVQFDNDRVFIQQFSEHYGVPVEFEMDYEDLKSNFEYRSRNMYNLVNSHKYLDAYKMSQLQHSVIQCAELRSFFSKEAKARALLQEQIRKNESVTGKQGTNKGSEKAVLPDYLQTTAQVLHEEVQRANKIDKMGIRLFGAAKRQQEKDEGLTDQYIETELKRQEKLKQKAIREEAERQQRKMEKKQNILKGDTFKKKKHESDDDQEQSDGLTAGQKQFLKQMDKENEIQEARLKIKMAHAQDIAQKMLDSDSE